METLSFQAVVVGTGAAGFSAALRLAQYGVKEIAVLSESVSAGTSRNTGSDKQTYFKLTLAGGEGDSVLSMAETLFQGQAVDGDLALCEAALSAPCFLRLAELGVPFPRNRYGEYVGYRTDHDVRRRATSAGPYTSRIMTECLERAAAAAGIPVLDGLQLVRILRDGEQVLGLLCLDLRHAGKEPRFVAVACAHLILATGGPAGIYRDVVYPPSQSGATGVALLAGVKARNMTEWQYGLASVSPRWNVSGTYMQALPRFVSTDAGGKGGQEFLLDFFDREEDLLSAVFLKGYEWPFDVAKVEKGSSIIDVLVDLERKKGRRVFLDFRENPGGHPLAVQKLSGEARTYLEAGKACGGTPVERLRQMNEPAYAFYLDHGTDLAKEPLEIALCAQHHNGGLAVDHHYRTGLRGLYAIGECAGTHGVTRPGGSALNAGQVGALRAAEWIAAHPGDAPDRKRFEQELQKALSEEESFANRALTGENSLDPAMKAAQERMSRYCSAFREPASVHRAKEETGKALRDLDQIRIAKPEQLKTLFRYRDILVTQRIMLSAVEDYMQAGGGSRGSAMYTDPSGMHPHRMLPEAFTYRLDHGKTGNWIQEIWLREDAVEVSWRPVHPIPREDDFFENVWRDFREGRFLSEDS